MIMKYCVVILLMLFIVSCSNRKHPSDNYPKDIHVYQIQNEDVKPDTFKKVSPANMGSSVNSSTASHYKEKEPDNMRGFDPASEDDMDDNGMSRYMENNDEEGWD